MLRAFTGSAWSPLQRLSAFHLGAWRQLRSLKVWDGSAWQLIASFVQPLSVSASNVTNGTSGSITTRASVTTVAGGASPFSYSWVRLSGFGTVNSPSSASTTFSNSSYTDGQTGIFRVTVTDALGTVATSDMTARWNDAFNGGTE